jgi:hypothetical protein
VGNAWFGVLGNKDSVFAIGGGVKQLVKPSPVLAAKDFLKSGYSRMGVAGKIWL